MKNLAANSLEVLSRFDTPTVSNAIEKFQVRDRTAGYIGSRIRCLFPDLGVRVGYAVTVRADSTTARQRIDVEPEWAIWQALERAPKPAFLVIQDAGGRPERACFLGEMMGTMAQRLGAVGVLTDGGVRDVLQLEGMGLQVYATGLVASHGSFQVLDVGKPVCVDGLDIAPGDLLHADANGLVAVPLDLVPTLPSICEQIVTRESSLAAYVRGPEFSVAGLRSWYGLEGAPPGTEAFQAGGNMQPSGGDPH